MPFNIGAFGENFPYTNYHNLNMDWIIERIIELTNKVENVTTGKVQIADPLQWDITKQYPQFMIVMDNGSAYLAMKPVPSGIDIENTEYWQKIFDVGEVFDTLKEAITDNDDGNSTVSSENRNAGELVWLDNKLKRITADITAGDTYTNSNTEDITIEEILNSIIPNVSLKVQNRLAGKKIAIYGDSWSTETWGAPWINRLRELSKASEIHVNALGSASMSQIYSNCWDSYVADIYIIEGGLNDVTLNTGANNFILALNNFTTAIRTVNSNAEIYFITPPKIDRSDFLNKKLPPDFYRTCIWRLANTYKYHVINGLKWVDITYADGVHPTALTAPIIGDYIYQSLMNFGDEETHIEELCTMGRDNTQILLRMFGGEAYITLQSTVFSPILSDGSSGIVIDIGTDIGFSQAVFYGKGNHTGAVNEPICVVTGVYGGNSQIIALCPTLVGTGATSMTIFSTPNILLPIPVWSIQVTS